MSRGNGEGRHRIGRERERNGERESGRARERERVRDRDAAVMRKGALWDRGGEQRRCQGKVRHGNAVIPSQPSYTVADAVCTRASIHLYIYRCTCTSNATINTHFYI